MRVLRITMLLGAAGVLAACEGGVAETIGFDRSVPDEFAVTSRAPLAMPPTYRLDAPNPGAPRPQEASASARGRSVVLGTVQEDGSVLVSNPDGSVSTLTSAEASLLQLTGAAGADPNIRRTVDQEATQLAVEDESFVDDLLFWRDPTPPGTVVDPEAERERINRNLALGQSVGDGEVIVIERRSRAPLAGIF